MLRLVSYLCNKEQTYSLMIHGCRLDGEHVVFGKVISGMDLVFAIEGGAGTYSGKPRKKVRIVDAGEIDSKEEDEHLQSQP